MRSFRCCRRSVGRGEMRSLCGFRAETTFRYLPIGLANKRGADGIGCLAAVARGDRRESVREFTRGEGEECAVVARGADDSRG